jgi:hypothetical protein
VLPLDQPVDVLGRTLTFRGHVEGSEPRDRWRIDLTEPGRAAVETSVGMFRIGGGRDEIMHQPAIVRHAAGDVYVAPASLETVTPERDVQLVKGRPVDVSGATLTFERFETATGQNGHGMTVWAHVRVRSGDTDEVLRLPYSMAAGQVETAPVAPTVSTGIASLAMRRMSVEQGAILVHATTTAAAATQLLSIEISTKPLIGALWAGTILLGIGCSTALARRLVDARLVARAAVDADAPASARVVRAAVRPAARVARRRATG